MTMTAEADRFPPGRSCIPEGRATGITQRRDRDDRDHGTLTTASATCRHIGDSRVGAVSALLGTLDSSARGQSSCWSAAVARRSTVAYPLAAATSCAVVRSARARLMSPTSPRSASMFPQRRLVQAAKNLASNRSLNAAACAKYALASS